VIFVPLYVQCVNKTHEIGNFYGLPEVLHVEITKGIMISVTEKAKERIASLRVEENRGTDQNIRVSVKGGGCSGLMYDLGFDDKINAADQVFEDKGIKILVDKKSLLYLLGTTLDFTDGLNGKGFQFINPNASRTCGCGESFSV
jgi:iron-sulfur cluster assembly protein